ncbi:hypothetical protein VT52_016705 [Streptomyces malaysiense]|uniref:Uncharacterized protein n=1 Tax=Streptomyces malaysiense TaxID=1428626 RepID=A0A1J4Q2R1_9ACTN|nr:hypothetical protein VT52_016705 [Streptomyces malaysiense]
MTQYRARQPLTLWTETAPDDVVRRDGAARAGAADTRPVRATAAVAAPAPPCHRIRAGPPEPAGTGRRVRAGT